MITFSKDYLIIGTIIKPKQFATFIFIGIFSCVLTYSVYAQNLQRCSQKVATVLGNTLINTHFFLLPDYTQLAPFQITVVDELSEKPIPNANAKLFHRLLTTDEKGYLHLQKIDRLYDTQLTGISDSSGNIYWQVPKIDLQNVLYITISAIGYEPQIVSLIFLDDQKLRVKLLPKQVKTIDKQANLVKEKQEQLLQKKEQARINDADFAAKGYHDPKAAIYPIGNFAQIGGGCNYSIGTEIYVEDLYEGYNAYSCNNPGSGFTGYINTDEFVAGVVAAEMGVGTSFPLEAKKAQAIAVRTYGTFRVNNGGGANCGMAYNSASCLSCQTAANATSSQVITYNGNIINALFSARCNGTSTQNANQGTYSGCSTSGNALPYCVCRPCSGHSDCNNVGESPCCYASNVCTPSGNIFGHGVGLCQRGAQGFANQGYEYCDIVHAFYTDICITESSCSGSSSASAPNLTPDVESLNVSGTTVSLAITIRNIGNASATSCRLGYYVSTDNTDFDNPILIGTDNIGALAPNETGHETGSFDLCDADLSNDYYYVGFFIDDLESIDESDEEDNGYWFWGNVPISVDCGTSGQPNLMSDSESLDVSGNTIDFDITIRNIGTISASSSQLGYYVSTDNSDFDNPIFIGYDAISSLAPNATSHETASFNLCSSGIPNATYYAGFFIDDLESIDESDEEDNGYWFWGSTPINIACGSNSNYQISLYANPNGSGSVSGTGNYAAGQLVMVNATANSGWLFSHWAENGAVVSILPIYQFFAASNRQLTAFFTPITALPSVNTITHPFISIQPNLIADKENCLIRVEYGYLSNICVHNLLGQIVIQANNSSTTVTNCYSLDLSLLASGCYFVSGIWQSGGYEKQFFYKKLVKK